MSDWEFVIWMTLIGAVSVWAFIGGRKRTKAMTALAGRLGLTMRGDRLPPELALAGTLITNVSATWNVMEGTRHGVPVIVFDCRVGTGKSSWRRTVIAARSNRDVFATMFSDSSYAVDHAGDWILFYKPRTGILLGQSLMPIPELEVRLSTLGAA